MESESKSEEEEPSCLICIMPCKEVSTDLFLYNCTCVYAIHKDCFIQWRRITQTDRICIICHEELEPVEDVLPVILTPQPMILRYNPGIEERLINNRACVKICILPGLIIIIFVLLHIIVQSIIKIYTRKIFFPFEHDEL